MVERRQSQMCIRGRWREERVECKENIMARLVGVDHEYTGVRRTAMGNPGIQSIGSWSGLLWATLGYC